MPAARPGSPILADIIEQDYLVTGELQRIREWNPATNEPGQILIAFGYDDLGRRTSLTRGNGTATTYQYDAASRLRQLSNVAGGGAHDLTLAYNPAAQVATRNALSDLYATAPVPGSQSAAANGLNQIELAGVATGYDLRGNMVQEGASAFSYTSDNLMRTGPSGLPLYYDPLGRLVQVTGSPAVRFTYDGPNIVAEWDGQDNLLRRYVHGPGIDEPLVRYEGAGTSTRIWLHADERGSIVSHSDGSGAVTQVNRYDADGVPASGMPGGSNMRASPGSASPPPPAFPPTGTIVVTGSRARRKWSKRHLEAGHLILIGLSGSAQWGPARSPRNCRRGHPGLRPGNRSRRERAGSGARRP